MQTRLLETKLQNCEVFMLYIIYDEVDEKNWMLLEAPNDRAAKRIMRQSIMKYQKDVDFAFSLRGPIEIPSAKDVDFVCNSDDLFKSDEPIQEEE